MRQLPMVICSCVVLTGVVGNIAQAAPGADVGEQRARKLYRQASAAFEARQYGVAFERYRQAYESKPLPGFFFNMGQCRFNMGQYQQAIDLYRQYLEAVPAASNRVEVERLISDAEAKLRLEQAPSQQADTAAATTGGTGGEEAASGGSVAAMKPDRVPKAEVVRPAPATPPQRRKVPRRVPPARTTTHRVLLWSGVALTGALLVTGALTWGLALDKSHQYKDAATPLDRQLDLRDSGRTLAAVSAVTLSLGAAAAIATSLYYGLVYRKTTTESAPQLAFGAWCEGMAGGIALGGGF